MILVNACPVSAQAPETQPGELVGTLEGGWAGIGGEHTGWVLRPDDDTSAIEVDVSCCTSIAADLDGQRVTLLGRWAAKQYVERGPIRVFVANEIRPAD